MHHQTVLNILAKRIFCTFWFLFVNKTFHQWNKNFSLKFDIELMDHFRIMQRRRRQGFVGPFVPKRVIFMGTLPSASIPYLYNLSLAWNGILTFIYGATPVDLLTASMASKLFSSLYLYKIWWNLYLGLRMLDSSGPCWVSWCVICSVHWRTNWTKLHIMCSACD